MLTGCACSGFVLIKNLVGITTEPQNVDFDQITFGCNSDSGRIWISAPLENLVLPFLLLDFSVLWNHCSCLLYYSTEEVLSHVSFCARHSGGIWDKNIQRSWRQFFLCPSKVGISLPTSNVPMINSSIRVHAGSRGCKTCSMAHIAPPGLLYWEAANFRWELKVFFHLLYDSL